MTHSCKCGLKLFELGPSNSTSSTGRDLRAKLCDGISNAAVPRTQRPFQIPPENPRRFFPDVRF